MKERFNNEGNLEDLRDSSEYFIKAIEKGIKVNTLSSISMQVGVDLGKLGEIDKINSIYQKLDEQFPNNNNWFHIRIIDDTSKLGINNIDKSSN